jgi:hypothetical protein
MPYTFTFRSPNKTFKCELERRQCRSKTRTGAQCGRQVVIGLSKCFHHLESEDNLKIKPSRIPHAGKGLFAFNRDKQHTYRSEGNLGKVLLFKPDDIISVYDGKTIDKRTLSRHYGKGKDATAPYVVDSVRGLYLNAACIRGVASIANTHSDVSKLNCKLDRTSTGRPKLIATKDIKHDDELYCDYGEVYHVDEEGVSHTTRYTPDKNKKKP